MARSLLLTQALAVVAVDAPALSGVLPHPQPQPPAVSGVRGELGSGVRGARVRLRSAVRSARFPARERASRRARACARLELAGEAGAVTGRPAGAARW
ncbi:hypothetical protein [Thiocapsa imhoffii]|uniref:hypothetical protein n=1 Tax=Thiocapsa imhoffii TaxID=382777 RepID=UPI001F5C0892|nr:hypothetical protein [Thiocapsa imhoffii]